MSASRTGCLCSPKTSLVKTCDMWQTHVMGHTQSNKESACDRLSVQVSRPE